MPEEPQAPQFEVVDENVPPPRPREGDTAQRRVIVLSGWRAKLLLAALLTAGAALLLTVGTLLAAAAVVGGTLLGAGWLTRKILSGGAPRKQIDPNSSSMTKR